MTRALQSSVDRDVNVVDVIGRVTAAIGHVTPTLGVPLDVPDVLVPDHVVDAELPGVDLGPVGDPVAERLPGSGGVVRDHEVERTTAGVIRQRIRPYAVVGRDL